MQKDIPEVFSGTVEVEETYLGGQWKTSGYPREKEKRPVAGERVRYRFSE